MPYRWTPTPAAKTLHLWPHRPLTPGGFATFLGATSALMAVPMVSLLGTPALWAVLGFALVIVSGLWVALRAADRDRQVTEHLTLCPDRVTLTRRGPRDRVQSWEAHPHWVRVTLYPDAGPVPQYLTLQGNRREVELGAFLGEEERVALAREVRQALADLR